MPFSLINEDKGSRKEKVNQWGFSTIKFASKFIFCSLILWSTVCHCICLDLSRNAYSVFFLQVPLLPKLTDTYRRDVCVSKHLGICPCLPAVGYSV